MRSGEAVWEAAQRRSRRRLWVAVILVALIVLAACLRGLAVFYTDFLWFKAQGLERVWAGMLGVKVGLASFFVVVFFVLCWGNLSVVDRMGPRTIGIGPEDELVRRYREAVLPRAWQVRLAGSLILALLVGAGASSEWNNWILFRNSVSFNHMVDPQFHHDISLYVFKMPFMSFLVSWSLAALTVTTVAVAASYYLTGGIKIGGRGPHVAPHVRAHLSVLLAAIAVVKAVGYFFARYDLLTARDGYAEGAFYTDVHVRMKVFELLIYVCIFVAVALLFNARRRSLFLPALSVGVWAIVAFIGGVVVPALVERLTVEPSQLSKEQPYISLNIAATRYAMGLDSVGSVVVPYSPQASTAEVRQYKLNLEDASVWQPSVALQSINKLQDYRSYYEINSLALNRLSYDGQTIPVLEGVRELDPSGLPSSSWVNTHLEFTHGYGMVISPANATNGSGLPEFIVSGLPTQSSPGAPEITQPQVYYGLHEPGYVIGNSKQIEVDFQTSGGETVGSHYAGKGGVAAGGFLRRVAFALRFDDPNVALSGQITPQSRVLFMRSIQSAIDKVSPYLAMDSQPYPVVVDGEIYWVVDCYTTTDRFPYAQQAPDNVLPSNSGLAGSAFNYIRNSVTVVVNAYDGHMTYYVTDPNDPIVRVYERAFPGLYVPASKMPAALRAQLRYPYDLFAVQAAVYGRYHLTEPGAFYNASDTWAPATDPGSGPVSSLAAGGTMPPQYEELELPGQSSPGFYLVQALSPASSGTTEPQLAALLVAGCDPSEYGKITAYEMPRADEVPGPVMVDSAMQASVPISQQLAALDSHGTQVIEGQVEVVPVGDSILYLRPIYVAALQNPVPQLAYVVGMYGTQVVMQATLERTLDSIFGSALQAKRSSEHPSHPTPPPTQIPAKLSTLIAEADADLAQAQRDLASENLAGYQSEVNAAKALLDQAKALAVASMGATASSA